MQPRTPSDSQTGTAQQSAGWSPAGSSGYPRPAYEGAPPAVSITKARPWLIALAAAATMLVLIGAIDNPSTTRSLLDHVDYEAFSGRLKAAISTFGWDFGQLSNDFGHAELANILMDVAVVVLIFLFVAVISRGSASFGRTFLGTWFAVIAACVFGGYVRSSVIDQRFADPTGHGKATAIFFSVSSPGTTLVFAAIAFGVVVALVAALVAVLTRRDEVLTAPAEYSGASSAAPPSTSPTETQASEGTTSPTREPWSAPPAAVPGPVASPSPWSNESSTTDSDDAERTTQLPAVDSPSDSDTDDRTRELPRTERES